MIELSDDLGIDLEAYVLSHMTQGEDSSVLDVAVWLGKGA